MATLSRKNETLEYINEWRAHYGKNADGFATFIANDATEQRANFESCKNRKPHKFVDEYRECVELLERTATYERCRADVSRPGKFEGEKPFAPYYHGWMLDGEGDYLDDNTTGFDVDRTDRAIFPELMNYSRVCFRETNDGFWQLVSYVSK